jgi:HKD family nuclease
MEVNLLTQPFDKEGSPQQFGVILIDLLKSQDPQFNRIWLVSAFADHKTILRLKPYLEDAKEHGAEIHVIVGIDLTSTSIEALQCILELDVDAKVVKNAIPAHTFHPKVFLLEATGAQAEIFVGSNNLTNGGLFGNYEATVWLSFDLKFDADKYQEILDSLSRFINPPNPITHPLTEELIETLTQRGEIVSQEAKRRSTLTTVATKETPSEYIPPSPFGSEQIPSAPPLPEEITKEIIKVAKRRQKQAAAPEEIPSTYDVTAFYMHLNKIQTASTPGEIRIPFAGRDVDPAFWGWPDKYQTKYRDRGKRERAYTEWKPLWRIIDTSEPDRVYEEEVRLYVYRERSEFRFYSNKIVELGAEEMDIVKITRCPEDADSTFQCELAHKGSKQHAEWEPYCNQTIRNSNRKYGFE